MNLNWNFLGVGGAKQKPSMGGVWIFLELHIIKTEPLILATVDAHLYGLLLLLSLEPLFIFLLICASTLEHLSPMYNTSFSIVSRSLCSELIKQRKKN